ncbi:hypothetical protein Z950_3364 [Sulfitobacter mediterraneus KCTC 32188]|nr:hypothetical protein Z950_3364 [Sulfitobacter mediterraneus KCTC 32188]
MNLQIAVEWQRCASSDFGAFCERSCAILRQSRFHSLSANSDH